MHIDQLASDHYDLIPGCGTWTPESMVALAPRVMLGTAHRDGEETGWGVGMIGMLKSGKKDLGKRY